MVKLDTELYPSMTRTPLVLSNPPITCKALLSDGGWESQRAAFSYGFQTQTPTNTLLTSARSCYVGAQALERPIYQGKQKSSVVGHISQYFNGLESTLYLLLS